MPNNPKFVILVRSENGTKIRNCDGCYKSVLTQSGMDYKSFVLKTEQNFDLGAPDARETDSHGRRIVCSDYTKDVAASNDKTVNQSI